LVRAEGPRWSAAAACEKAAAKNAKVGRPPAASAVFEATRPEPPASQQESARPGQLNCRVLLGAFEIGC
jgi:hypothetical protein